MLLEQTLYTLLYRYSYLPQVRLVISSTFTHRGTAVMLLASGKVKSGFSANFLSSKRECLFLERQPNQEISSPNDVSQVNSYES